jgi:hypothetical protein
VVYAYLNDALVLTQELDAADKAFFNGRGGSMGLEFLDASGAVLDDFGGGTITPPANVMNQVVQAEQMFEEVEQPTVHSFMPVISK